MLGISSRQDSAKEKTTVRHHSTSISLAETDMGMETGNAPRGATLQDSSAAPCKGKRAALKPASQRNEGCVHRKLWTCSQKLDSSEPKPGAKPMSFDG